MRYIIHLSDLHIANCTSWENMKNCLLETIKERTKDSKEGEVLLAITGDFHDYNEDDYNKAKGFINSLIGRLNEEKKIVDIKKDIFMIPGNHDLFISDEIKGNTLYFKTKRLLEYDISDLDDESTIELLNKAFIRYGSFCKELGVYENETDPISVHVRTWRDALNIIHINTALVADGKRKNNQVFDIKRLASENTRKQLNKDLPVIVLGHNNFFDLKDDVGIRARATFGQEKVRAYLCGDNHVFNNDKYKKNIPLGDSFGESTIPNIVCCKSATDETDQYSNFGFLIHCWDENTGAVRLEQYEWERDSDQNSFKIETNMKTAYSLISGINQENQPIASVEPDHMSDVLLLYREYIRQQCSEIELNGLPTRQEDLTRAFALERIFVPVSFSKEINYSDISINLESILNKGKQILKDSEKITFQPDFYNRFYNYVKENNYEHFRSESFRSKMKLDDFIPQTGTFRYIILADPGAGKTTLLKFVASYYAFLHEFCCEDIQLADREVFPIWIRCREIMNGNVKIQEIINNIPKHGVWGLDKDYTKEFGKLVNYHIKNGNALLLIDGLDEIGNESIRDQFIADLNSFIDSHATVNVIITSREKGFSFVSGRAFNNFDHLHINSLSDDEIIKLCQKWYALMCSDEVEAENKARKISRQILTSGRVKTLALNPLLLTTMLLVERRLGRLPSKRAGLYYEAVKVLIETWNPAHHEPVDLEEALYQLAYIAFAMSTSPNRSTRFAQINQTELLHLLTEIREEFSNLVSGNGQTPALFVQLVERRSALLVKTGEEQADDGHLENVYEFQHLTFQEYLAAYAVAKCCYPHAIRTEREGQVLIKYLLDNRMQEIIQLTAAIEPFCAQHLADATLELYEKTDERSKKKTLRDILLNFVADEVAISHESIDRIFDCCFDKCIYYSDISFLRSIISGKYKERLYDFFKRSDEKNHDGFSHWMPLYDLLVDETLEPRKEFLSLSNGGEKEIAYGVSLLVLDSWLRDNEANTSANKALLREKVFEWANHNNKHVRYEAMYAIGDMQLLTTNDEYEIYVNAFIDLCNEGTIIGRMTPFDSFLGNENEQVFDIKDTLHHISTNAIVQVKQEAKEIETFKDYLEYLTKAFIVSISCERGQIDELNSLYKELESIRKKNSFTTDNQTIKEQYCLYLLDNWVLKSSTISLEVKEIIEEYSKTIDKYIMEQKALKKRQDSKRS